MTEYSAVYCVLNMSKLCFNSIRLLSSSFGRTVHLGSAVIKTVDTRLANFKAAMFHTSCRRFDLMEFFDDENNWGAEEVKVGRSWKVPELRLKSNEDLHKLWYILLKEKNMLLTMEHECKEKFILFPNPERIDKVEESMSRLETVVRERNRAYNMLEIGSDGERPVHRTINEIGYPYNYKLCEHPIPKVYNRKWRETHKNYWEGEDVAEFLKLLVEKKRTRHGSLRWRDITYVRGLLKRFDNIDMDALKKAYPDVDIEEALLDRDSDGHREVI